MSSSVCPTHSRAPLARIVPLATEQQCALKEKGKDQIDERNDEVMMVRAHKSGMMRGAWSPPNNPTLLYGHRGKGNFPKPDRSLTTGMLQTQADVTPKHFPNPLWRTQPGSPPSPNKGPFSTRPREREEETRPEWAGWSLGRGGSVEQRGRGEGQERGAAIPRERGGQESACAAGRPASQRSSGWGRGGVRSPSLCVV